VKGEEFFGKAKERRAIDDFDVRGWSLSSMGTVFLYWFYEQLGLHEASLVDVFFVASYLLEVFGFFIIFCDLFLERQTKQFLDWYARFSFTHPQSFRWKGVLIGFISFLVLMVIMSWFVVFSDTLSSNWDLFGPIFVGFIYVGLVFVLIYPGFTLLALKIKNDKLLAMGVGTAMVGLTLSTSAYINTLFL